jgi:hypothetical protein
MTCFKPEMVLEMRLCANSQPHASDSKNGSSVGVADNAWADLSNEMRIF